MGVAGMRTEWTGLMWILALLPLVALVATGLVAGCSGKPSEQTSTTEAERKLLILENSRLVVGILPRVGGRVVLLRRTDGANVFLTDPAQWDQPEEAIPVASPTTDFVAYNGHIVWAGPQGEWWSHQTVNPGRQGGWPPDPYLIFGDYKVVERGPAHVKMVGPESPVCGLQMTKEITLLEDKVVFKVTGTNIRDENVSWDLWPNSRLVGESPSYVPVASADDVRIDCSPASPEQGELPHEIVDGFFTFRVGDGIPEGKTNLVAKAFIRPSKGVLAAFVGGDVFVKRAEIVPPEQTHPNQAFAEIWNNIWVDTGNSLLELETHGAYRTLAQAESMEIEETWEVHPYAGENTTAAHVAFLKGLGVGR
jgi:hypothetical protein